MISSQIFEDDHAVWGEDDTNTLKQHIRLSCQTNLKLAKLAYLYKPAFIISHITSIQRHPQIVIM